MEGDGFVLYRELDTITTNQLHTTYQAKRKRTSKEWFPLKAKKKTKDIMKGLGIGYVPAEASSPVTNAQRVRKERKIAPWQMDVCSQGATPTRRGAPIRLIQKVESNQLYGDCSVNVSGKVS